jgi:Protein kinase domain
MVEEANQSRDESLGVAATAPPPAVAHPLTPGEVIGDRYRIVRFVGEGAMGAVYLAEHVTLRTRVALKLLHRELCTVQEVVTRFEREAIAAGNIDHPHIARASDFGTIARDGANEFYLILEYVEGVSLHERLTEGPLPLETTLAIAKQILSGLARAHELGIVHRDLKPENVMLVSREGVDNFVKILDFGIARVPTMPSEAQSSSGNASAPALTRAGMVYGTPEYMSPEQAVGGDVDARADLYSLGVMLFEMISGKRPFEADNFVKLLGMHVTKPAPRLSERVLNVPSELDLLLNQLLAKDAAARPQTAREVSAILEPLMARGTTNSAVSLSRIATTAPVADLVTADAKPIATAATLAAVPMSQLAGQAALSPSGRPVAAIARDNRRLLLLGGIGSGTLLLLAMFVFAIRGSSSNASKQGPDAAPSTAATIRAIDVLHKYEGGNVTLAEEQLHHLVVKEADSPEMLRARLVAHTKAGTLDSALTVLVTAKTKSPELVSSVDAHQFYRVVLKSSAATGGSADATAARTKLVDGAVQLMEAFPTEQGADMLYEAAYGPPSNAQAASSLTTAGTAPEQGTAPSAIPSLAPPVEASPKPARSEVTERCKLALKNERIFKVATPALQAALSLREVGASCKVLAELPRVVEVGDQRSVDILLDLRKTRNIVVTKKFLIVKNTVDTLYCLKKGDPLGKAINQIQSRR